MPPKITPIPDEVLQMLRDQNGAIRGELAETRKSMVRAIDRQTIVVLVALVILGAIAGAPLYLKGYGIEINTRHASTAEAATVAGAH